MSALLIFFMTFCTFRSIPVTTKETKIEKVLIIIKTKRSNPQKIQKQLRAYANLSNKARKHAARKR